jgi:hypothetical protein
MALLKKDSEKAMGDPRKYIEAVGLNNPVALTTYVISLEHLKPKEVKVFETGEEELFPEYSSKTFGLFTEKKPVFQKYLNKLVQKAADSKEKIFFEKTCDGDFAQNPDVIKVWEKSIRNGLNAQVIMDCGAWNSENPKILEEIGVDVNHLIEPNEYHFGFGSPDTMFTLNRYPANPRELKIQGMSQFPGQTNYQFFSSNKPEFVDKTKTLWEELKSIAIDFKDQKARINKNGSSQLTSLIG